MSRFDILLFDADDTIFDFQACEKEALKLAFDRYNLELNQEIVDIYHRINQELWKKYELGLISRDTVIYSRFALLFQELGIDDDGIAFEDEYQKLLGKQHFFIDRAEEVVKKLSGHYDLYVVTNGVTETQYSRLRASGIDRYMKKIFVSEETGYQKPMKEYFDYCFARIENFNKDRTLIIGDSLSSDIKGGNNAGIAACWYNPKKLENVTDCIADYEISRLTELYSILGV